MKTQVCIQVFSNEKAQVQINDGNKLVESVDINNGEEKIFELEKHYTITINEVKK